MHGQAERIAAGAERIGASAPELAGRLASFVARERLPGAAAGVGRFPDRHDVKVSR